MTFSEIHNWAEIKKYLLQDKSCKNIHKMIWDDYAVLTDRNRKQYRIPAQTPLELVKNIVMEIKAINGDV